MVSDTRHTVSRDASLSNQRTSMGSEEQGTYLPQASNLHSGTWRYSGQRDTSREGIELQAYRSPDRAVQFYRS